MQVLVVDRIENDIAVCETKNGDFINISVKLLPNGIKEGSILIKNQSGDYILSNNDEIKRKQKLFNIQEGLSK